VKAIITGGAGFIGCNAAIRFLKRGDEVIVIDDLSRPGAEKNLAWLEPHGRLSFVQADVRKAEPVAKVFRDHADAQLVLHLAGQVAVTTSVSDPRSDFESNALGTFNVLEAVRHAGIKAPFIFSSTNKVYGGMEDAKIVERDGHYCYATLQNGVPETRGLDFHSPYGCSKGAADQYVRDYHRIYGLNTVVLRQSCIYGYRQFGVEDQGWVAWFTIASVLGRPITVYGDGRQVRDVLFINDLLDAFDAAASRISAVAGRVYNIGGGAQNTLSLLDLLGYLEQRRGKALAYQQADWRPGDQRVYVSDIRLASQELAWAPRIGWRAGLELLYNWVSQNQELFDE
jgi:CDP-paratose 2-epimerase